jgi:tetratricopeptide (TPR) repeat protein
MPEPLRTLPTAPEPFGVSEFLEVPEPIAPPEPEPEPVPPLVADMPKEVTAEAPTPPAAPVTVPLPEELGEIDFCLEQGMVVDAAERLQSLDAKYPGDPELAARRARLEGTSGPVSGNATALGEILSDDLESVLDAELGKALTDEMARDSGVFAKPQVEPEPVSGPTVDESGLFSDEAEFFNFAEELQTELKQETTLPQQPEMGGQEVSLEEIFREFKKGVEQQLSPEDYETHYNLGIAYKEMMLTDEAIGEFQLAAKDPLHAVECCSMLGLCFLEKGLPQLAIKWYRKGLDSPNVREDDRLGLLYDLANVYQDVGDRDSAYRSFIEIYGSNASYRDVGERLKELASA